MPPKRKVTVAVRRPTVKKPRVAAKSPAPISKIKAEAGSKYDRGIYPCDSHQDSIVVNSIETDRPHKLTGAAHYIYELTQCKSYAHICVYPRECHQTHRDHGSVTLPKATDSDCSPSPRSPTHQLLTQIESTYSKAGYPHSIYKASTTNPLIALAITLLAARNMPDLDFHSALRHIPNAPLSGLRIPIFSPDKAHPTFLEDEPVNTVPSAECHPIQIAFFPAYSNKDIHLIGYYTLIHWPSKTNPHRLKVQTCIFTPATSLDLQHAGLMKTVFNEESGAEEMACIGARDGLWADDKIGGRRLWKLVWQVARVWEERIGYVRSIGTMNQLEEGRGYVNIQSCMAV